MTTPTHPTTNTADSQARSRRQGRALVSLAATGGAAATWLAGRLFDAELILDADGQRLDVATVAVATFIAALAGWAGLALLERFAAARARLVWTIIALVIVALSFVPVFGVEVTAGTFAVLIAWHIVAAVIIVGGFLRTARPA